MSILVGVQVYFSPKKGKFDRFFDLLDRPVDPTGFYL